MQRRIHVTLVALGLMTVTAGMFAQHRPATGGEGAPAPAAARPVNNPPGLMWRETWRMPAYTGEIDDVKRRVTQEVVTNPQLELKVYGPNAKDLLAYEHNASVDGEGRFDLWTGISAPVVLTLRDKNNFADLSKPNAGGPGGARGGLARLRVIVRTGGLHTLYPVVKLADGTVLAGDFPVDTDDNFRQVEISFNDLRWYRVNLDTVAIMLEMPNPDLSKVDEIGLIDMSPGGGHRGRGWANISTMELYAKPVKR